MDIQGPFNRGMVTKPGLFLKYAAQRHLIANGEIIKGVRRALL